MNGLNRVKGIVLLLCLLFLAGCGEKTSQEKTDLPQSSSAQTKQGELTMKASGYEQITPEEAKTMMDKQQVDVLLDVRSQKEFDGGHIEGAIVIPDTEIANRAETELSDKESTILVYCRSGRRSKLAAQALADLGYTNVYEFGGIIDWPYETVK